MDMHFKLFILLLPALLVQDLKAQVPEYTRHLSRSFLVSNSVAVEINNKYGKVQVIPWDMDSVRFDIDLRIRAKDHQKLEKMKQNLEFEFTPGQYFLIAQTKFGTTGSDVFKDIVDIAGSYLSSSNSVTINYTVRMPAHLTLRIENKFGDVYFEDHTGGLKLNLSYGDLKANHISGNAEIKLTSGDAEINYLKEGLITVSYGNMHIRESAKLTAQTQSSVITIDKMGSLKLSSRRDKLYLNELNFLSGESYFSTINIGKVNNEITINSRYGDIIIDNVRRSFSTLNVNSELTDLTISFERPLIFGFELTHHQAVIFTYPSELAHLSTKVLNPEEKIFTTSGSFGAGTPETKVKIKALRKSNLTILQR
jgi:hypothetical protein